MAFVDRKKQPHLWRDVVAPQHLTPEQIVMSALANHAAGLAVDFADRLIAKAFARFKLSPPQASAPAPTPTPTPKKPRRARAPK